MHTVTHDKSKIETLRSVNYWKTEENWSIIALWNYVRCSMESKAKELDYGLKSSMNTEEHLRHSKAWIQSVKWMKNSENLGLKHPHAYMNVHSIFVVRCGAETHQKQATMKLNGGNDELKHKQNIERDLYISGMRKWKEELNSPNRKWRKLKEAKKKVLEIEMEP